MKLRYAGYMFVRFPFLLFLLFLPRSLAVAVAVAVAVAAAEPKKPRGISFCFFWRIRPKPGCSQPPPRSNVNALTEARVYL